MSLPQPTRPSSPPRSTAHRVLLAASVLPLLGLVLLALLLEPDPRGYGTHEGLGLEPCMTMQLWHVPCPGCGVTTAVTLAAHGRLLAALGTQPLGFLLFALALLLPPWALLQHLRGRDLARQVHGLVRPRLLAVLCTFALLAWTYKLVRVGVGL